MLLYMIFWTFFGLIFLLYVNIVDLCMTINIMCLENSTIYD